MIILFYKSLKILGTTSAVSVNYSINCLVTFILDVFLSNMCITYSKILGIISIFIGISILLVYNNNFNSQEEKEEEKDK